MILRIPRILASSPQVRRFLSSIVRLYPRMSLECVWRPQGVDEPGVNYRSICYDESEPRPAAQTNVIRSECQSCLRPRTSDPVGVLMTVARTILGDPSRNVIEDPLALKIYATVNPVSGYTEEECMNKGRVRPHLTS